jgi:heat shock protein HtpX
MRERTQDRQILVPNVTWQKHKRINALQSLSLLAAMAGLLSLLGWMIAGAAGIILLLMGGLLLVLLNPRFSPGLILRAYRAERLGQWQAPTLHSLLATLARRAALPTVPALYYVPSTIISAFSLGAHQSAAVAITDGMLRALGPREINGVLAHEVSHIRHNDMWVMGLADLFARLTTLMSFTGQLLLVANLPLLLLGEQTISWLAILVLLLAPTVNALMQLALSRTREFHADLRAAELSGDPQGLAMALAKMERLRTGFIEQILLPGRRIPEPSLLRTHPPTEERIRRLLELQGGEHGPPSLSSFRHQPMTNFPARSTAPRWHLHGIWY